MYAARGPILEMTGKRRSTASISRRRCWSTTSKSSGVDWDIVWDDRGHFREPHTGHEIGLGTLRGAGLHRGAFASRRSTPPRSPPPRVSTQGPAGRYGAVLFIEKEGFTPILEAARIPERFDIAPMSHQGHERHGGAHAGRRALRAARPARCSSCTISTSPASRSRRR